MPADKKNSNVRKGDTAEKSPHSGPTAKTMKNQQRIGLLVVYLLSVLAVTAMAATPAGTQIRATGTAQYYSTSGSLMPPGSSNVVTTTVMQVASVSLTPTANTKQGSAGSTVDFPLTAKNTGNGSDTFDMSVSKQNGSTVTIYRDDNGDGVRQTTETTIVTSTGALSIGGAFNCIASAKLPSSAATDTITVTTKSRFNSTKTSTSTLTIQEKAPSAYVTSWLVNGYYPNSDVGTLLSTDYLGGEVSINPSEGGMSNGKPWTRADSPTNYLDLAKLYGNPTYCAAYMLTYVYSPAQQTVNMWVGSDDGVKIWLNGAVVWTNDIWRLFSMDSDKFTATLPSGWSRLLVKVSQAGLTWGCSLKFCNSAGNPLPGVTYALTPPAGSDTTAPVISNIKISPSSTTAVVEWDTNEAATTLADYGTTSSLGTDYSDGSLTTHHTATLSNLVSSKTYYLKVGSADAGGNTAWQGSYTFQTTALTTPSSPYIISWLVNGYYPNSDQNTRLTKGYIGQNESYISPTAGMVSAGNAWKAYTSPYNYTDFNAIYGNQTYCAAYAYSYIYSPSAVSAYLWIGSADGVKVWLTTPAPGGPSLFMHDVYRSYVADQDKVAIPLKAGWNGILVKISKDTGDWRFSVKVCDSSGKPIPGIVYSTTP